MGEPKRILIVDDEQDVSRYLTAALEDAGYEVLAAGDAAAGLDLMKSERPDLVCLDLVMPGRTGISLYREIRETPEFAHLPIVVVTGVSPADAASKLGLGNSLPPPDAYFEKPVDIARLIESIRDLVAA